MNRVVFAVHSWAGLFVGILILAVSLTGSVLVLGDEIDRIVKPSLRVVEPCGGPVAADKLVACVRRCFPAARVESLTLPRAADAPAILRVREHGKSLRAVVNPYTGKLLGVEKPGEGWYRFVLKLHYTFFLGKWGELLTFAIAFLLLFSVATGLYVYRKSILSVFRRGFRPRRVIADLHTFVGVSALAFHLVIALTGGWMLRGVFRDVIVGPREKTPLIAKEPTSRPSDAKHCSSSVDLDSCLARARESIAGFEPRSVEMPQKSNERLRIWGRAPGNPLLSNWNHVDLDATTGQVLSAVKSSELDLSIQLDRMVGPLHFGTFGGLPVKILYAILGLTPGLLSVSGFILWWRRHRRIRVPCRI